MTHLFASLSLQVLEMMTTWGDGVEVVVVAALVTEGVEVQEQVATGMDPPVEERQTSGNRLKVTPPPVCLFSVLFVHKSILNNSNLLKFEVCLFSCLR